MDASENPKDWELNEEIPPERMRRKWEEEEIEGFSPVLCFHCERAVRTDSLLCPFCGETLSQRKRRPSRLNTLVRRILNFFRRRGR